MPAELDASLYSGGHACPDALSNQFALKLGKGSDQWKSIRPASVLVSSDSVSNRNWALFSSIRINDAE